MNWNIIRIAAIKKKKGIGTSVSQPMTGPPVVTVITSSVENGLLVQTSWTHPLEGQPDSYLLHIAETVSDADVEEEFELSGSTTQHSVTLTSDIVIIDIILESIVNGVIIYEVEILPDAFNGGGGQMSEQDFFILLKDTENRVLRDSQGNVLIAGV